VRREESLRLAAYSDRDLLGLIVDVGDGDGWATNLDVAVKAFGSGIMSDDDRRVHAVRCVGVRLSWMRRFGVVERHERDQGTWRLSSDGEQMLNGTLGKTLAGSLSRIDDSQLLHLGTAIADRSQVAGPIGYTMMRRAWQYGVANRKR